MAQYLAAPMSWSSRRLPKAQLLQNAVLQLGYASMQCAEADECSPLGRWACEDADSEAAGLLSFAASSQLCGFRPPSEARAERQAARTRSGLDAWHLNARRPEVARASQQLSSQEACLWRAGRWTVTEVQACSKCHQGQKVIPRARLVAPLQ